jgi:AAA+ ATPase superfamily predicted ATPase
MLFVNRKRELEALKRMFKSENFEFYVIYGRRRIGKTALALQCAKGKKFVYFLASEEGNAKKFKSVAAKSFPEIAMVEETWESLLTFLKGNLIIIDEFPNMVKENPKVLSEFQRIVDLNLKETNTKLIFLGSSISMMESSLLSYSSPLYGRRTGQLKLKPLRFLDIQGFCPKLKKEELMEVFGLGDGIPYYLEKIDVPLWHWLDKELKRIDSFLKTEVDFLIKYEFSEGGTYKKILEAIALGNTTLGEIKNYGGFRGTDITPYLKNLIRTEFVVREIPMLEPVKSRKGKYYIKDNFVKFWFRYIYTNLSFLEEGTFSASEIKKTYPAYLGFIFERACKEFLVNNRERIFSFSKIGRWWHNDKEIDLVSINDETKEIGFFECKWKALSEKEARAVLYDLKEKSKFVEWNNGKRKEYFGIFAKKLENKAKLRKDTFLAFDLDDFGK